MHSGIIVDPEVQECRLPQHPTNKQRVKFNICLDIQTIRSSKKCHCQSKGTIRQRTSISYRCYGAFVFIEIEHVFCVVSFASAQAEQKLFVIKDGFFAQIAECFAICVFAYWFISAISRFVFFFFHTPWALDLVSNVHYAEALAQPLPPK